MANPVDFEIHISIKVNEDGVLTPVTHILVDGEQIGYVNRLRVDYDVDELPSVQVDMLRGASLDLLEPQIVERAKRFFDQLSRVPGLKCTMPAPRQ